MSEKLTRIRMHLQTAEGALLVAAGEHGSRRDSHLVEALESAAVSVELLRQELEGGPDPQGPVGRSPRLATRRRRL